MVPFPDVERCLGLLAKDSTMKIHDGYAIMAFDYTVKSSNQNCLFNMKDNRYDKELRMAKKNKGLDFDIAKATQNIKKMAEKNLNSIFKLPPLPDFDIKNLNMENAMNLVK